MNRITAFIGAGSISDLKCKATTNDLTDKVHKIKINTDKPDFISKVFEVIEKHNPNFETIFHTIEMLNSYHYGSFYKGYEPVLSEFTKPVNDYFFNDSSIYVALRDILFCIGDEVDKYNKEFKSHSENLFFIDFWKNAVIKNNWDIFTLNYDTCVEECIEKYNDGYEGNNFIPRKLFSDNNTNTLAHLHGCILYGYGALDLLNYKYYDLVKYESYIEARKSWETYRINKAQSGEILNQGPMLTGLRKSDKLGFYPYPFYFHKLQDSILKNSSLLIIGYSFGDLYFNRILESMRHLHGNKARIVLLMYWDWEKYPWSIDWPFSGWLNNNEISFIGQSCSNPRSFMKYNPKSMQPLISEDNCLRIYLHGFKEAVLEHSSEILNYLSS